MTRMVSPRTGRDTAGCMVFFFSSRRRHTRFDCDWSSDVCSSDLVHILGICGTFMGGVAALARAAGFRVSGSDRNVYPPISTQLEALGIPVTRGFEAPQLTPAPYAVLVGNVQTRGPTAIDTLLRSGLPLTAG